MASVHPSSFFCPRRRHGGFTLLETMIGLAIFIIAGLGVMDMIGLINQNTTVNRALTAGRMLVQAKISKAQTDVYTPSNSVVPLSCTQPTGTYANQDTTDPFDFSATSTSPVTVVGSSDTGPVITGTMTQAVSTFEAASRTLLITYTLTFTVRSNTYTITQSTVRAPDQL